MRGAVHRRVSEGSGVGAHGSRDASYKVIDEEQQMFWCGTGALAGPFTGDRRGRRSHTRIVLYY